MEDFETMRIDQIHEQHLEDGLKDFYGERKEKTEELTEEKTEELTEEKTEELTEEELEKIPF